MITNGLNWLKTQWKLVIAVGGVLGVLVGITDNIAKLGILTSVKNAISIIGNLIDLYPFHFVISLLVIAIGLIFYRVKNLEKFTPLSFKDNFNHGLNNWEYHGNWQITPNKELIVTDSGYGGITKHGQLWTDYDFEFSTVILAACVGWIVRAQDHFNSYMIQITTDSIRPHLLIGGRYILLDDKPIKDKLQLNQSINIRTRAIGSSIRIFINEKEIYDDHNFFSVKYLKPEPNGNFTPVDKLEPGVVMILPFASGRVGFRCDGAEKARFTNCRITPL